MTTPHEIFVSYDNRDRDYVRKLAGIMESAGLNVRTDFDLPYGANFYRYMETALRECFVALLVISKHYIENGSWARIELMELISRHVKGQTLIIPLLIDDIPLNVLPFGLQTIRYISDKEQNPQQLLNQMNILKNQLVYGRTGEKYSNIGLKAVPAKLPETSERRIRVQMTNKCNFKDRGDPCNWCHWEEFDKKHIRRQPKKVISILEKLRDPSTSIDVFPRPRMDFTLTGGEPLYDTNFPKFLELCSENSYVITNGFFLEKKWEILKESKIKNIRISYQPSHRDEDTERAIKNGINKLLEGTNINVRFNYVLPLISKDVKKTCAQIDSFIDEISKTFSTYLVKRIRGIAFLQQFQIPDPSGKFSHGTDIFRIADAWGQKHGLPPEKCKSPFQSRKRAYIMDNKLEIEFIKVNCDYTDDYVWRCLSCAMEKDICMAADGRIRICSGWDIDRLKPKYIYAHYGEASPLKGISGAIKREYGTVGFYTHFPLWMRIVTGEKCSVLAQQFVNQCQLREPEVRQLLREAERDLVIEENDFRDWGILPKIAALLIRENGPFVRIYHEGICPTDKHTNSIKLCMHLIKSAYQLARQLASNPEPDLTRKRYRSAFLITLVLLEYLSVDESLFSTGRTVLAQGISTELLKNIVIDRDLSVKSHADAIYCLGAIALENTETSIVEQFVNSLSDNEQRVSSAQIQYLLGCIYRQDEKNEKATKAFKSCVSISKSGVHSSKKRMSLFEWLYPELEAEANRSLGATLRSSPSMKENSLKAFEAAELLSIIHDTKLRYIALFSDGYAAMCQYFEGKSKDDERSALKNFSYSLAINPDFYACLIRMAILELEICFSDETPTLRKKAISRLHHAREIFSDRGLLTDQEYLNNLLCEYSLAIAEEVITAESLPDPLFAGIELCTCIGKKDAECVRNDAQLLLKIIDSHSEGKFDTIHNRIKVFIDKCNELISKL